MDGHIKIEKCCIVVSPLDVDQHRCALSSRALNEVFKNKVFEIKLSKLAQLGARLPDIDLILMSWMDGM